MSGKPQWLREAEELHGTRVLAGAETPQEASAAVAAQIAAHPEYLAALAASGVGAWTRKHEQRDLFHAELFPYLPAYLDTAPGTPVRVADLDRDGLDKAYRMAVTRSRNVARAARRHRKAVTDFRNRVRPLLADGKTVGEVMPLLEAQERAA